jgi:hypothetical protein
LETKQEFKKKHRSISTCAAKCEAVNPSHFAISSIQTHSERFSCKIKEKVFEVSEEFLTGLTL